MCNWHDIVYTLHLQYLKYATNLHCKEGENCLIFAQWEKVRGIWWWQKGSGRWAGLLVGRYKPPSLSFLIIHTHQFILFLVIEVKSFIISCENTMLTDSSVRRCQSLFLVEVVSQLKLAQKLGNISRKLTSQSFWWAAASAEDVWWWMGAKFFLQKDTSSYIWALFFSCNLEPTSRIFLL